MKVYIFLTPQRSTTTTRQEYFMIFLLNIKSVGTSDISILGGGSMSRKTFNLLNPASNS